MTPNHSANNAELNQMQKEWRESVAASIHSTENKVDQLLAQMNTMRAEYVKNHHFDIMVNRVSCLEGDKNRIIGAAVLLNALGALVLYLVTKFWK